MIGGISACDRLVVRLGDNLVATHNDRADGDFVHGRGAPRLLQRGGHAFKHVLALAPARSSTSFRLWIGRRARDRPRRTAPRVPIPRAGSATVAGSRASTAALHTRGRSPRRRAAASPPA